MLRLIIVENFKSDYQRIYWTAEGLDGGIHFLNSLPIIKDNLLTVIRIINNLRSHVYRNSFFDLELVIQYENHLPYIVCGYKENSTQYLKLEDLLYLENSDQINIKFFNTKQRINVLG